MWKKELISKGVISCKQLGCTFTCSSYETICEHYYQCDFIPQEVCIVLYNICHIWKNRVKHIKKPGFFFFNNCKLSFIIVIITNKINDVRVKNK